MTAGGDDFGAFDAAEGGRRVRGLPPISAGRLVRLCVGLGAASVLLWVQPALARQAGPPEGSGHGGSSGSTHGTGEDSHDDGGCSGGGCSGEDSHEEGSSHSGGQKGGASKGDRGGTAMRGAAATRGGVKGHVFDQPEGPGAESAAPDHDKGGDTSEHDSQPH